MKPKFILIMIVVIGIVVALGVFKSKKTTVENNTPTPLPIVGENPEGEADPNRMTLNMKEWVWISAQYNDGKELKPKVPGKFVLIFNPDGRFFAMTDCNNVGGKYKVTGNQITLSEMMSTLMACQGSQESDFMKILENTDSFFFTSRGELIFDLKFDSGTATFR